MCGKVCKAESNDCSVDFRSFKRLRSSPAIRRLIVRPVSHRRPRFGTRPADARKGTRLAHVRSKIHSTGISYKQNFAQRILKRCPRALRSPSPARLPRKRPLGTFCASAILRRKEIVHVISTRPPPHWLTLCFADLSLRFRSARRNRSQGGTSKKVRFLWWSVAVNRASASTLSRFRRCQVS